jgi:hypothetical protein
MITISNKMSRKLLNFHASLFLVSDSIQLVERGARKWQKYLCVIFRPVIFYPVVRNKTRNSKLSSEHMFALYFIITTTGSMKIYK